MICEAANGTGRLCCILYRILHPGRMSSSETELLRLALLAYEAAAEPTRWPRAQCCGRGPGQKTGKWLCPSLDRKTPKPLIERDFLVIARFKNRETGAWRR